jgi:soluble lytic murein transglycosylase-like protein
MKARKAGAIAAAAMTVSVGRSIAPRYPMTAVRLGNRLPGILDLDQNGRPSAIGHKVARLARHEAATPRKTGAVMIRRLCFVLIAGAAIAAPAAFAGTGAVDSNGNLDSLIARHAAANNLPEDLIRRVIKRESRGNPRVISSGNYGLMQIRLGTARAMGYSGNAVGLLDADTNMTYAVKYLAGAYRAAEGNPDRAVHYYAAGYYYAAKNKGLLKDTSPNPLNAFASAAAGQAASDNNAAPSAKSDLAAAMTPAAKSNVINRFKNNAN